MKQLTISMMLNWSFNKAVNNVLLNLAKKISDGEGASKFIQVDVTSAKVKMMQKNCYCS